MKNESMKGSWIAPISWLFCAVLISVAVNAGNATDAATDPEPKSAEELAKETQNPVANLISVPFQNNFNFGIGPNDTTQWVLNVQPVIPISLNKDWNLITRTIVPIINQPSPGSVFPSAFGPSTSTMSLQSVKPSHAVGIPSAFGLGDINPTVFLSPANPGKLIWGVGPTMTFPTATEPLLGNGKWSAGPSLVLLTMPGHWVIGALANNQWSFAGWGRKSVDAFLVQAFINYNFPHGWYVTTQPIITANWLAASDQRWTLPIGGGVGRLFKVGKQPINVQLQAFDNVVTPNRGGPDWQPRFQVQFLFPK